MQILGGEVAWWMDTWAEGREFESCPGQIFFFFSFRTGNYFFLFFCLHWSKVVKFNFPKKKNHNIALPLAFHIYGLAHRSLSFKKADKCVFEVVFAMFTREATNASQMQQEWKNIW